MKALTVVIPSRNGKHILEKYITAILEETIRCGGELIVVDDCSTDGTAKFLLENHPSARVIERTSEPGFCRAVNLGMEEAHGEYLLLLNNDTIPEPGSFKLLLSELSRSDSEVAAAVPSIPRPDGSDDSLFKWIFRRGLAVTGQNLPGESYPSGACALWKREAWKSLNGLDSRYAPIYWEDTDLGVRMHKMGYTMIRCRKAVVRHMHAATMGALPETEALRERNRFIFMDAHCSGFKQSLSTRLWLPVHLFTAFLRRDRAFTRGYAEYRKWGRKK